MNTHPTFLTRIRTYLKGAVPSTLSAEQKVAVHEAVKVYNLKSFSMMTFFGGTLAMLLLGIDYYNYSLGVWEIFLSQYYVFLVHIFAGPIFMLVGGVTYYLNFSEKKEAPNAYEVLISLNLLVTAVAVFVLYYWEIYDYSSSGIFIIYIFIITVVQQFPLRTDIFLNLGFAFFYFGPLLWMGVDFGESPALYLNGIATFALAFVLSRIVYTQRIQSLTNRILLEAKNKELQVINENLNLFTRTASHDLREPLRAIITYLNLVKSKSGLQLSQQATQYINFSIDSAQRLNHLIDDLLHLSRLDNGTRNRQIVDLQQLVEDVKLHLNDQIEEKKAQIITDSLPAVKGDYSQFLQLFQNLISNGIKYNENASPVVHLMAYPVGNRFIIIVRDNGIGIQKQFHETIFQAFSRLYPNEKYQGSGIGLTICKKIVESYGGDIKVRSTEDDETEFLINFPAEIFMKSSSSDVEENY